MTSLLDRYAGLSGDAAAFREVCGQPLPETGWMPGERLPLLGAFPLDGAVPLPWTQQSFRFPSRSAAFGLHFLTGGLLLQEEAAMTAVRALDPQPGDRVLDLCAAPGNKTVQLVEAVGPTGWVVANDVSASRLNILHGLADRFGMDRLSITVHDGASFPERDVAPGMPLQFDRVLADVPCSCEGTCRTHPDVLDPSSHHRRPGLPDLQEALLRKAIRLTRPGGVILYATCTFAPEENEGVVARVLEEAETGQDVTLEPIALHGFVTREGLDSWNGHTWPADMNRSAQIWPQDNDTGGFFLARLRKNGSPETLRPPWPAVETEPLDGSAAPWNAYALDPAWLACRAEVGGGLRTRIVGRPAPLLPLNVASDGMTGLNRKGREPRLSSDLARWAAPYASAGVAELAPEDVLPFLMGLDTAPVALIPPAARTRFALVRSSGMGLGLGHVGKNGRLASLFPKHAAGLAVRPWLDGLSTRD